MRQLLPEIGVSKVITPENTIINDEEDDDFFFHHHDDVERDLVNITLPQPIVQIDNIMPAPRQASRPDMQEDEYTLVTEDTAFVTKNYLGIDPASGLIEVFVHFNKRENFIVQRTATIASLKQMISERKGIPVDIQRLVFAGKVLQNNTTLEENKILCGCSIHLFIRLQGGEQAKIVA